MLCGHNDGPPTPPPCADGRRGRGDLLPGSMPIRPRLKSGTGFPGLTVISPHKPLVVLLPEKGILLTFTQGWVPPPGCFFHRGARTGRGTPCLTSGCGPGSPTRHRKKNNDSGLQGGVGLPNFSKKSAPAIEPVHCVPRYQSGTFPFNLSHPFKPAPPTFTIMCGIAGQYCFNGRAPDRDLLGRMSDQLVTGVPTGGIRNPGLHRTGAPQARHHRPVRRGPPAHDQ